MCLPCAVGSPQPARAKTNKHVSFDDAINKVTFDVNEYDRANIQFHKDSIQNMTPTPPMYKAPPEIYSHNARMKEKIQNKPRELRRALLRARILHKQVLLDDDSLPELDEPELGRRRSIMKKIMPDVDIYETASARYEGVVRQFLVDSG